MPRGIPNKKSSSKKRTVNRLRKAGDASRANLISALDQNQALAPMSTTTGCTLESPRTPTHQNIAIVTIRQGTMKQSAVEKIREDFSEIGVRAILIEHSNYDGPSLSIMMH